MLLIWQQATLVKLADFRVWKSWSAYKAIHPQLLILKNPKKGGSYARINGLCLLVKLSSFLVLNEIGWWHEILQDLTARIDHLTAHQELGEGEAAHLQCLVTLSQPDAVDVIWQRRVISGPKKVLEEKLARNGKPEPDMGRVSATVRPHRGGDQRQLEYSLLVKDLMKNSDEGMYDCQVSFCKFRVCTYVAKNMKRTSFFLGIPHRSLVL